MLISVITPAYNESKNLPLLYEELKAVFHELGPEVEWEWVLIDDHSKDDTFAVFKRLAQADDRLRGFRFSRNYGSHKALTCGMREARGDCAVVLAADLQDPPSTIHQLLAEWKQGAQIVWAVRAKREGQNQVGLGFSNFYYWLMRRVVGLNMPSTGADFFLIDRQVLDAFHQFNENNVSIFALLCSMGFRQAHVDYVKEARRHGSSGWTLGKKVKLLVDSITAFTFLPIRLMSYLGFIVGSCGFLYAAFIIRNGVMSGLPVPGWSSLMVVVLLLCGTQMMMIGVLGEYVWRALDETRARPLYLIESTTAPRASQELERPRLETPREREKVGTR